jgi:hypothetical protein
MTKLRELLGGEATRPALIRDACKVLDEEVADKSGLSGVAVKAAYGAIKGVKAGFIPEVVDALMDDFLDALDPLRTQAEEQGVALGHYLQRDPDHVAERLLAVTDARVEHAERTIVKKTYSRLRPSAKKHVTASVPRLAQMVGRHLPG